MFCLFGDNYPVLIITSCLENHGPDRYCATNPDSLRVTDISIHIFRRGVCQAGRVFVVRASSSRRIRILRQAKTERRLQNRYIRGQLDQSVPFSVSHPRSTLNMERWRRGLPWRQGSTANLSASHYGSPGFAWRPRNQTLKTRRLYRIYGFLIFAFDDFSQTLRDFLATVGFIQQVYAFINNAIVDDCIFRVAGCIEDA